jgi:hypothetical protein
MDIRTTALVEVIAPGFFGQIDAQAWPAAEADQIALLASMLMVTEREYRDFAASSGQVQCCALTRRRKRCKHTFPDDVTNDAAGWARIAPNWLCPIHGGDLSREREEVKAIRRKAYEHMDEVRL